MAVNDSIVIADYEVGKDSINDIAESPVIDAQQIYTEISSHEEVIMPISMLKDSVEASDSLQHDSEPVYAILLTQPEETDSAPVRSTSQDGLSYIFCGLFIFFLIVALRFRNNMKYVGAIFRNLIDTRMRNNAFDDTVRETSLIVLLNVLWCVCTGIIGFCCLSFFDHSIHSWDYRPLGMLTGMGIAVIYSIFMAIAYLGIGWIFADFSHARLWLKGFGACQALMTPFLFIIALIAICWQGAELSVAITASVLFISTRLVFIWKGFRIFFTQFSSWVLFLCYLCSLEIVPLVMTYRLATLLGEEL